MTARVRVTDDFMIDQVAVMVSPREGRVLHWEISEEAIVEAEAVRDPHHPSVLRLDEAVARAVYEALSHHFGGGADTAALRRDYDAERKRVDTFIAHFTKDRP